MTDEAFLALIDAAISALLSGGAVEEWREGAHLVRHMRITELYELKQQLENRIAQAGGSMLLPIREINQ